jgi:hypothetical protein
VVYGRGRADATRWSPNGASHVIRLEGLHDELTPQPAERLGGQGDHGAAVNMRIGGLQDNMENGLQIYGSTTAIIYHDCMEWTTAADYGSPGHHHADPESRSNSRQPEAANQGAANSAVTTALPTLPDPTAQLHRLEDSSMGAQDRPAGQMDLRDDREGGNVTPPQQGQAQGPTTAITAEATEYRILYRKPEANMPDQGPAQQQSASTDPDGLQRDDRARRRSDRHVGPTLEASQGRHAEPAGPNQPRDNGLIGPAGKHTASTPLDGDQEEVEGACPAPSMERADDGLRDVSDEASFSEMHKEIKAKLR